MLRSIDEIALSTAKDSWPLRHFFLNRFYDYFNEYVLKCVMTRETTFIRKIQ